MTLLPWEHDDNATARSNGARAESVALANTDDAQQRAHAGSVRTQVQPADARSVASTSGARGAGPVNTVRARSTFGAAENRYLLIYGKKGMGKTLTLRELSRGVSARGGCLTFVDPTHRNGDLGEVVTSAAGWFAAVRRSRKAGRPFCIVVQPQRKAKLNDLWVMVYEVGDQLLSIDEAQRYANAQYIDDELKDTVAEFRNRQVSMAVTVRTPPELNGIIRGNQDAVMSFRQPSAPYAEKLNDDFFHDPRVPAVLQSLPKFYYLRVEDGTITGGHINPPK